MRKIESLDAIDIPVKYKTYLSKYINNISSAQFISRVILFGSCARENVGKYSDIDLFITTNREITEDEEGFITFYCIPEYSAGTIPTDIIVQSENEFNKYTDSLGMVQKRVIKEGLDLSGLLSKR